MLLAPSVVGLSDGRIPPRIRKSRQTWRFEKRLPRSTERSAEGARGEKQTGQRKASANEGLIGEVADQGGKARMNDDPPNENPAQGQLSTETLPQIVGSTTWESGQISARTRVIHAELLRQSRYLDTANFTCIHPTDLERLFSEYDERFFQSTIQEQLLGHSLRFALSKRLTSSGGQTKRTIDRRTGVSKYEISVSTTILFGSFDGEDHRPIQVSGIVCHDRLEALQRVMEHELVHLVEMLIWGQSSCAKGRFQSIAYRFFGHTHHRHQLITPKEKAVCQFGIKTGMRVRFSDKNIQREGMVNRINRRATVLVEDPHGVPYSDGKRYLKFYVPIPLLSPVDNSPLGHK